MPSLPYTNCVTNRGCCGPLSPLCQWPYRQRATCHTPSQYLMCRLPTISCSVTRCPWSSRLCRYVTYKHVYENRKLSTRKVRYLREQRRRKRWDKKLLVRSRLRPFLVSYKRKTFWKNRIANWYTYTAPGVVVTAIQARSDRARFMTKWCASFPWKGAARVHWALKRAAGVAFTSNIDYAYCVLPLTTRCTHN